MKRHVAQIIQAFIIPGIFMTGCISTTPTSAPSNIIVTEHGSPSADIVIAADASEPVRHAASELAVFIKEITGCTLSVTNAPGTAEFHILVGPGAAKYADASFSTDGLGQEGIVIRSTCKNLILAGGEPRGTLYAVYTFLEEYSGCHWWSAEASAIPRIPDFIVSKDLNVRYVPPLEYRWPFWTHINQNPDLAVRNRVNGPGNLSSGKYGGNMSHGGVHTFYVLIPPAKYYQDHPEWFSEINGKREHDHKQLCLSNESLRHEMVKNLKAHIRNNPRPPVYSVSQNDWHGFCTCKQCNELAQKYGGQSGLMIWFVNLVGEEIEKEFPDVSLSTLAYQYTRSAPVNIRPRNNVIVQLCSIECSFSVPLEHERNKAFRNDVMAWSKVADRLYIWDYVTNFRHHFLPHPNLRVLAPNIRFLVAHNAKGIFEQGAYTTPGAEFAELRGWVLAKLLWNPNLDGTELTKIFIRGYYGESAGAHILNYISLIHDAVAVSEDHSGCFAEPTQKFLSFEIINSGWKELLSAENKVIDDPVLLNRVKMAQLPVLYAFMANWKELRHQCQAAGGQWPMPEKIEDVAETFKQTATANKVNRVNEWNEGFGLVDQFVQKYKE